MTTSKIKLIRQIIFLIIFSTGFSFQINAQTGISVSPPKLYYVLDKGQSKTEEIIITNVSKSNELDLAISLGNWKYNSQGENQMFPADTLDFSCASWISLNGSSYISLKPGETKKLDITLTVPDTLSKDIPVHTAILYVTQMNPVENINQKGANMKVSVRSGIKLYHRTTQPKERKIDIKNLAYDKEENKLKLTFENKGNVWIDGNITSDLLQISSGKEISLDDIGYYTLPGDVRRIEIPLPSSIAKGGYTITTLIDTGDENVIEAAELRFTIE